MSKTEKLNVVCPDCGGELVVDVATGTVLVHKSAEKPIAGGADFDSLLAGVDSAKEKAAKLFDQELSSLDDRGRLLEAKFDAAFAKAQEEVPNHIFTEPEDLADVVVFMLTRPPKLWMHDVRVEL